MELAVDMYMTAEEIAWVHADPMDDKRSIIQARSGPSFLSEASAQWVERARRKELGI